MSHQTRERDEHHDGPTVDEGFHVVDEQSANWVVRKITESRRYGDRVRAWAAAEIRRAEREEQFFMDRFGRELETWCRQVIDGNDGRRRSLDLPAGRTGFRMTRPTLTVVDSGALLRWCRENLPEAIEVTERVAKTPLQTYFGRTGELPSGVEVSPQKCRFFVERSSAGEVGGSQTKEPDAVAGR